MGQVLKAIFITVIASEARQSSASIKQAFLDRHVALHFMPFRVLATTIHRSTLKYVGLLLAGLAMNPVWADFDPTAPPKLAATADAPAVSALSWVRVDGKNSVAWYGGMTVKLGDRVEGGRIAAIHEDHIVIAGSNGRRIVPLLDPQVQHRAVAHVRPSKHHSPQRKTSAHRD